MNKTRPAPEQLLKERFGFTQFLPGQQEVIDTLLDGHSAAAVFPTGGGKSLCYQIPALALPGLTLVVSPLIALMKDQIDALHAAGVAAARLDSSLSAADYREVMRQLRDGSLRLLYVAPERFNNERFRQMLAPLPVALFAVDEAHCISEWGHNFRPDYLKLARFAAECGAERILALTATAPPKVLKDICRELSISHERAIRTSFYRPNLRLLTSVTTAAERDGLLLTRLKERERGPTIVYVTLQKTAENVAGLLQDNGYAARYYHAGMKPEQRVSAQDWFIHGDGIIVATIAFGMGIDKSDIRYIYHYNLSKSIENYAQEIGRAGRDGLASVCETLAVGDDLRTLENFVYGDTPDAPALHSLLDDLFARGADFGVSVYHLAAQHDIRDLVVRTLLTYLELDGYLQGGTPYYAEYRFKPLFSSAEILQRFDSARRDFLAALLRQAKPASKWFSIDVDQSAAATGSNRQRVVRALDYLAEQQMIELKVAGVHHRYRRLKAADISALAASLYQRSLHRQQRELERLAALLDVLTYDGCQASALGAYFGEPLARPCGNCSWCESGQAGKLTRPPPPPIETSAWAALTALRAEYPDALAGHRALARFACGISSPALVKARLTRHALFGSLAEAPFAAILAAQSDDPE